MRKAIIIITAIGVCFGGLVQARQASTASSVQYRWRDAQGLAHYSDSLSSDAIANGYDVVNSQGLVMRHVDYTGSAWGRQILRDFRGLQYKFWLVKPKAASLAALADELRSAA